MAWVVWSCAKGNRPLSAAILLCLVGDEQQPCFSTGTRRAWSNDALQGAICRHLELGCLFPCACAPPFGSQTGARSIANNFGLSTAWRDDSRCSLWWRSNRSDWSPQLGWGDKAACDCLVSYQAPWNRSKSRLLGRNLYPSCSLECMVVLDEWWWCRRLGTIQSSLFFWVGW